MREETHPAADPICPYCKQPITEQQRPYKSLESGERAHLACYIEHMNDEDKPPSG